MASLLTIFKKAKKPEEALKELKQHASDIDQQMYGLEFDLKKLEKERERTINKGVKAHKSGDAVRKKEAAEDLKGIKGEIGYLQTNRTSLSKSRSFVRVAVRRLENSMKGSAGEVMERIMTLLNDDELNKMLQNQECSEESFQEELERKSHILLANIEARTDGMEADTTEEEEMFGLLADAEEKGDVDTVARVTEKLTGTENGGKDTLPESESFTS